MAYGYGHSAGRRAYLRRGLRRTVVQQAPQVVAQPTVATTGGGIFTAPDVTAPVLAAPAAAVRAVTAPVAAVRAVTAPIARLAGAGGGQVGRASFYSGPGRTASGGRVGALTCAHRWLPFGTRILVTNLANARQTVLTVNDRGPFVGGRIVDVSRGAAGVLGMLHSGTAPVRLQVMGSNG